MLHKIQLQLLAYLGKTKKHMYVYISRYGCLIVLTNTWLNKFLSAMLYYVTLKPDFS